LTKSTKPLPQGISLLWFINFLFLASMSSVLSHDRVSLGHGEQPELLHAQGKFLWLNKFAGSLLPSTGTMPCAQSNGQT
jgi:hypothetical protein